MATDPAGTPAPKPITTASSAASASSTATIEMFFVSSPAANVSMPAVRPATAKSPTSVVPRAVLVIGTRNSRSARWLSRTGIVTAVPPSTAVYAEAPKLTASGAASLSVSVTRAVVNVPSLTLCGSVPNSSTTASSTLSWSSFAVTVMLLVCSLTANVNTPPLSV